MLKYNPEDIQKLKEEYPEFNIEIISSHVPIGSMNFADPCEDLIVSTYVPPKYSNDGSYSGMLEALKNPRRRELVEKIKRLERRNVR